MLAFTQETIIAKLDHYQVIDFFAGMARITRLAQRLGLAAVCLDKDLSKTFDMCTSAGFVLLAAADVSLIPFPITTPESQ